MFTHFVPALTEADIEIYPYIKELPPAPIPWLVAYLPFLYIIVFIAAVTLGRHVLKKFR